MGRVQYTCILCSGLAALVCSPMPCIQSCSSLYHSVYSLLYMTRSIVRFVSQFECPVCDGWRLPPAQGLGEEKSVGAWEEKDDPHRHRIYATCWVPDHLSSSTTDCHKGGLSIA